jgi:biopolymer transport protein ExbD
MAASFGGKKRGFTDINVTPLVDVMLVLLVVFMVTAPLLTAGLRVELPNVEAHDTAVKDTKLVITVTREERILFGEEDVTQNLEDVLTQSARVQREKELYIRADKNAHYGAVARVVAAPPRRGRGGPQPPRRARAGDRGEAMSVATLSDFRASEILVSVMFGCAMLAGAGLASSLAALDRPAAATEIDRGTALPVRVTPVLDLGAPLLKLGGKRDTAKLPDRWVRQAPRPRVERRAFASTKAGKSDRDIPPPEVKMAAASIAPPPPDAEVAKQVDTPVAATVDAGAPANVDQVGHADGVKGGTETDPLKARAVDIYRAKIAAWFSSRFRVSGSGLGKEELVKVRVSATVALGPDRTVSGYTIAPSGNAAFDRAARATLEGAKGQPLPPPPENYPDVAQSQINVTFVCRENRCD